MNKSPENHIKKHTYYVTGMHCASCEVLIENRLLQEKEIKAVEASAGTNRVTIEYLRSKPDLKQLNKIFIKSGYTFSDQPVPERAGSPLIAYKRDGRIILNKQKIKNLFIIACTSIFFIIAFLALNRSGLAGLISVNSASSLPAFFIFGVLAGFSTCMALVGGIILSMTKQWLEIYKKSNSLIQKLEPHLLFNLGRLLSYGLIGILLGLIGNSLKISLTFTSLLTVVVSFLMILLGLQMLGVKYFKKFQISSPEFITKYITDEKNYKGKYIPFLIGFLTIILPCGFTITSQSLALISGSPLQGGLIMLSFALGTLPGLFLIGFSTVKISQKPHLSYNFLKIAGVLVLFFALFNINSQLNVLGFKSLNDLNLFFPKITSADNGLPPIVKGKQLIKMNALSYGYEPNRFKVKVGIPVRWEITDKGTSGCTNAVISKGLFSNQIDLYPGKTAVREFTPQNLGIYKFSCWMGMVSGTIEVVNGNGLSTDFNNQILDSGAEGCTGKEGCTGSCGGGCGNPNCPYKK